jgi:DNA-binding NtrC family response regulator
MPERLNRDAILIVDDELDFANGLARLIQKAFPGNPVIMKHEGESALKLLQERPCALMITDLRMPGMDGFALLKQAIALEPALSVIVLTGFGTIETAVAALKTGAYDFLTKPIDQDGLYGVVAKGLDRAALLRENRRLKDAMAVWGPRHELIGDSPAMRRLSEQIEAVAATDYTVLILGESGTGKELVARTIHRLSSRGEHTMVNINCTAIPEHLLESELFGHVKGAFTGADKPRQGLFLAADGSSLHLDEIGDLPLQLQPKILRALQEREIRPVGGTEDIPVNVRILASTNRRIETRIQEGAFRDDLYYRLNVLTVRVPALRERASDIPLLALHCLRETCRELGSDEKDLSQDALEYLASRRWPGNVRELINFVRRLAVFCRGRVITQPQIRLLDASAEGSLQATGIEPYKDAKERFMEDFTRSYVQRLLEETGGNISQAARLSGLERVSLQKILRRLGIGAEEFRSHTDST